MRGYFCIYTRKMQGGIHVEIIGTREGRAPARPRRKSINHRRHAVAPCLPAAKTQSEQSLRGAECVREISCPTRISLCQPYRFERRENIRRWAVRSALLNALCPCASVPSALTPAAASPRENVRTTGGTRSRASAAAIDQPRKKLRCPPAGRRRKHRANRAPETQSA